VANLERALNLDALQFLGKIPPIYGKMLPCSSVNWTT
jgi:hypothetical protein